MIEAPSRALASVTDLIDQLRASGLPTEMATNILDKLSALPANATVRTVEPPAMNADTEPAAKLLADVQRRVANAGRARAGAIAGIQTQECAIAALRERGQDTAAAETLLEHFRAIFQRSEDELGRVTAEHSELADRPRWRLNDG